MGDSGIVVGVVDAGGVGREEGGVLVYAGTVVEEEMDDDVVGDRGSVSRGGESASNRLLCFVGEVGFGGRPDHSFNVFTSSASHDTALTFFICCSSPPSICLPSCSLSSTCSSRCLFLLFSARVVLLDSFSLLLSSFMNAALYHGFLGARTHSIKPLPTAPPPTTGGVLGLLVVMAAAAVVGGVRGAVFVKSFGSKLQRRQRRSRRLASRSAAR